MKPSTESRAALMRRLHAEEGCSPHEIAAFLGCRVCEVNEALRYARSRPVARAARWARWATRGPVSAGTLSPSMGLGPAAA